MYFPDLGRFGHRNRARAHLDEGRARPCSLGRVCLRLRRRPESIAGVVFCLVVVEACCGLPLMFARLVELIVAESVFRSAHSEVLVRLMLLRTFIIGGTLYAVPITWVIYKDLRALPSIARPRGTGSAGRWYLTEIQQGSLQRGGKMVVAMGICLSVLHTGDVWLTLAAGFATGLIAQGMLCASLFLLVVYLLLLAASLAVYSWHWQRHGPSSQDPLQGTKTHGPCVDLDSCSRVVERGASFDICCICLCSQAEAEEVSTLPCGHTFHRACLGPWVSQGRSCPLRCTTICHAA